MTPETSLSPLPALPVRQRGTLEIVDTALKLYRRYFGVLMAWSALVAVLISMGIAVPFGTILAYPLGVGSCACCIAAAVRGQRITFGQVWDFTKPRYGALLLLTFLSFLLMSVAFVVIYLASALLTFAGAWLLSAVNAPTVVSVGAGIIGALLALIFGSIASVMAFAWLGLVPIIVCLEDNMRGIGALGRAWELMKGSWGRVLGLSTLLTVAITAVMGIVGGLLGLFGAGLNVFSSDAPESAFIALGLSLFGFLALFFLFWNPIQNLILAVLYLDLRVRKEALDLEWSSYNSTPAPPENNAAPAFATQNSHNPFAEESVGAATSPASFAPIEVAAPAPIEVAAPAPQTFGDTPNRDDSSLTLSKSPVDLSPASMPASMPADDDFASSFGAGALDASPFSAGAGAGADSPAPILENNENQNDANPGAPRSSERD